MVKKVISLALSENVIKKLDKTSKALGISRSELIELMLEKGFTFPEDVQKTINKISELQRIAKEKMEKRR